MSVDEFIAQYAEIEFLKMMKAGLIQGGPDGDASAAYSSNGAGQERKSVGGGTNAA